MKSVDFSTLYGVKVKGEYINFFDSELNSYQYSAVSCVLLFEKHEINKVVSNVLSKNTSVDEDDIEVITIKLKELK